VVTVRKVLHKGLCLSRFLFKELGVARDGSTLAMDRAHEIPNPVRSAAVREQCHGNPMKWGERPSASKVLRTRVPSGGGSASVDGDGRWPHVPAVSLKNLAREAALAAERRAIVRALEQTRWNRVKAAKLLTISYRSLLYKIKHFQLEPGTRQTP
jgi:transcriptional regulator with GAF, ATPase, and Fis domain